MFFEIEPKSRKADFFNYGHEYGQVKNALEKGEKIVAVVGVRRVGKTSLLNITYNETKNLKVWLDGRIVTEPKKEIFAAVFDAVKSGRPRIFGKIESLNVSAYGVGLGVRLAKDSRTQVENAIRSAGRVCVFIDEAQRMKKTDLADVMSYFYDRFPKVSFIISGSEIGLVEDILGENDAEHPLYGREVTKVVMNRLDENSASEYLRKGFAQVKLSIEEDEIAEAVAQLDGLVGWLTLYGYERGIKKSRDALDKASQNAARIAATELTHFLKKTRNRRLYLSILRNATGASWEELRARAGKDAGKRLNQNLFNFALQKLVDHSFVEKKDGKYALSDPLLLKALFLI